MTTNGISETGIQPHLIRQQMNELEQQNPANPDKGKETAIEPADTVSLTAGIWGKELMEIDAIEEEDARVLSQLAASSLVKQSLGLSTGTGIEALRALV